MAPARYHLVRASKEPVGGSMKRGALALAWALVASTCGSVAEAPAPTGRPSLPPLPALSESDPKPTPAAPRVRFFVASESTDQVWVLEGDPLAVVSKINVGRFPHNLSVSPDGRWVAVANRLGDSASVIDPRTQKEIARVVVGKQPHEIIWAPDSRTIFVGSERTGLISRIEAETWKPLAPLMVRVPQHTFAIWKDRPNELWFTVTNAPDVASALRVYDLGANQITQVRVSDVHDIFFTPDGSELWSSSSGFLCKPSDRMVVYDPVAKVVKQEVHFPGRYPFHSIKYNRDATFFIDQDATMVLSDHGMESLMVVDWRQRSITGSVPLKDAKLTLNPSNAKCGIQPFHTAYLPGRYYVTSNADNSIRVVDAKELAVLQRVEVTTPHGIVLVPLDR